MKPRTLEGVLETLTTQIHHSECRFHAKYISESDHHKEIDMLWETACLAIQKDIEGCLVHKNHYVARDIRKSLKKAGYIA